MHPVDRLLGNSVWRLDPAPRTVLGSVVAFQGPCCLMAATNRNSFCPRKRSRDSAKKRKHLSQMRS